MIMMLMNGISWTAFNVSQLSWIVIEPLTFFQPRVVAHLLNGQKAFKQTLLLVFELDIY